MLFCHKLNKEMGGELSEWAPKPGNAQVATGIQRPVAVNQGGGILEKSGSRIGKGQII